MLIVNGSLWCLFLEKVTVSPTFALACVCFRLVLQNIPSRQVDEFELEPKLSFRADRQVGKDKKDTRFIVEIC